MLSQSFLIQLEKEYPFSRANQVLAEDCLKANWKPFAGHPVAGYIRKHIPEQVRGIIGSQDTFKVEGSEGQGNWTRVPWVAVMNTLITDTVQDRYYIVYLVKEDFSGIYLSLNQGVTTVQKQYGAKAMDALAVRAKDYQTRLKSIPQTLIAGKIDLACKQNSKLGPLYEHGSIFSYYYEAGALPNHSSLAKDLLSLLEIYDLLSTKDSQLHNSYQLEDDEIGLEYEDLKKVRMHKRIERNKKLSKKVKPLKGSTCEACDFNFAEKYGEIGEGFIEAHHLKPVHTLTGDKVALDPIKDFAVLCSNCHRMIHKSEFVADIMRFKDKYIESD